MNEIEKAIEALENTKDNIKFNADFGIIYSANIIRAFELSIAALRSQLTCEQNEPLTLEELRGMDGEPVYGVDGCRHEAWLLVDLSGNQAIDSETGSWDMDFYDMREYPNREKLHLMGWLAYRNKPNK
jgi:hypothetical protein